MVDRSSVATGCFNRSEWWFIATHLADFYPNYLSETCNMDLDSFLDLDPCRKMIIFKAYLLTNLS